MQTSAHRSGSIAHFSVAVQAQKADYICIMNTRAQQLEAFGRLLDIMDDLRQNCPWDRKQTFESLRHLTIEETYELADAILDKDVEEIRKETGDLLLHMVFYAKIGSELPEKKGRFDIADALNGICDKLIDRHPHIYGDVDAADEDTVKANWEKLKLKEGKSSVLQGVPKSLPSLVKAYRVQDKVRGVGFDWDNAAQVWAKVKEELDELREELDASKQNQERITDEFGDVLVDEAEIRKRQQVVDVAHVPRDEVVHGDDLKPFLHEAVAQVRAQKSSGTGDQHALRFRISRRQELCHDAG